MASVKGTLKVDVVASIAGPPHESIEVVTTRAGLIKAVKVSTSMVYLSTI